MSMHAYPNYRNVSLRELADTLTEYLSCFTFNLSKMKRYHVIPMEISGDRNRDVVREIEVGRYELNISNLRIFENGVDIGSGYLVNYYHSFELMCVARNNYGKYFQNVTETRNHMLIRVYMSDQDAVVDMVEDYLGKLSLQTRKELSKRLPKWGKTGTEEDFVSVWKALVRRCDVRLNTDSHRKKTPSKCIFSFRFVKITS
jgi:hypothetical protein